MSNMVSTMVKTRKVSLDTTGGSIKSVLTHMADSASDDGSGIWTSKTTIAAQTEFGKRTVQRNIDELLARGLICKVGEKKCKNGFTIEYSINLNAVLSLPPCMEEKDNNTKQGTTSRGDNTTPVSSRHPTHATMTPQEVSPRHPNHNKTINEPCVALTAPQTQDLDLVFEEFKDAHPRFVKAAATRKLFDAAAADGVEPSRIIAAAKAFASEQAGNDIQYIAGSESWLAGRRWEEHTPIAPVQPKTAQSVQDEAVANIKTGRNYRCVGISRVLALDLVKRGLVTGEEVRAVDLATVIDLNKVGVSL